MREIKFTFYLLILLLSTFSIPYTSLSTNYQHQNSLLNNTHQENSLNICGSGITNSYKDISNNIISKNNKVSYNNDKTIEITLTWRFTTSGFIFSSPAVGDVDGDGHLEVIFGSSDDHNVYVLNGEDGSLLWKYDIGNSVVTSPALGDLEKDGYLEIVISGNDNFTYVLNGEDGSLLWKYKSNGFASNPVLGDVDGDGRLEVVFGSSDHNVYVLNGEDGSLLWTRKIKYEERFNFAMADLDNDGKLEIVFTGYISPFNIYVLNGEDGSILTKVNLYITSFYNNHPSIGDIDGDNRLEVIVGMLNSIIILNEDKSYTRIPLVGDGIISTSTIINDVDDDGELEVIFGTTNHDVYCFSVSGSGFRVYWQGFAGVFSSDFFPRTRNVFDIDPDMDMLSTYSESIIGSDPSDSDTDGDGLPDGWEYYYGLNTTNSDDALLDGDGDGLTNLVEFKIGTNPIKKDTDNDLFNDGLEVSTFSDPLNKWDNLGVRVIAIIIAIFSVFIIIRGYKRFIVSR